MNDHGPDPEVEHAGGRLTGTVRRMLATAIALLQTRAKPRFLESTLDELKRDRAAVERVQ